jgi:hypothetical protein
MNLPLPQFRLCLLFVAITQVIGVTGHTLKLTKCEA